MLCKGLLSIHKSQENTDLLYEFPFILDGMIKMGIFCIQCGLSNAGSINVQALHGVLFIDNVCITP